MPKFEPVRWYAILVSIVALVAFYVPDLPVPLVVAVIAAVFGVGEVAVRSAVSPVSKQPPNP